MTPPPSPAASAPLARYLALLLAVAILPLLVVATVLIWRQGTEQRRETELGLLATARATSLAVDRQINSYRVLLEVLSQSELLDRGDLPGFHAYAKRVAESQGAAFVSLFDPTGRHVLNTARPYGAALGDPFNAPPPTISEDQPPAGDVASLRRVFASGRPSNSDLFVGLTTQRVLFTIDVPVLRAGKVVYALNAAFAPETMNELLAADPSTRAVRAAVIDRNGFSIGSREADGNVGTRVSPETSEMLRHGDQGSAFMHLADGTYVFRAFTRSPMTGWATVVSIDGDDVRSAEWRIWLIWGSAALVALLLSVVSATRLARALSRSIGRLAQAASTDEAPGDYGLHSRELDRLRDALVEAKQSRASALRALETAMMAEARRVEAEAANRDKDRFVATVAHELRTPLSALANITASLKAGTTDDRQLGIVQRQVEQLTRLVEDLTESSRINFGKFSLQLAPLDLREVVRQALEAVVLRHRYRHQAVDVRLPDEPVIVQGDRARLNQVVSNLVDNAMKFTPPGGAIRIDLATHVGHAVLAITDSGDGIDPEFLPHVFNRFAQAPGMRGAGDGLGLGLAVARDLVLAHCGRIEATSDGTGARFTVTLPLATAGA